MKIKLILTAFFAILMMILLLIISFQAKRIDALRTAKTNLEANNQLLISKMQRAYDDKMEISRKIEQLESMAKNDANFDWSFDISNSDVVKFLRENSGQIR